MTLEIPGIATSAYALVKLHLVVQFVFECLITLNLDACRGIEASSFLVGWCVHVTAGMDVTTLTKSGRWLPSIWPRSSSFWCDRAWCSSIVSMSARWTRLLGAEILTLKLGLRLVLHRVMSLRLPVTTCRGSQRPTPCLLQIILILCLVLNSVVLETANPYRCSTAGGSYKQPTFSEWVVTRSGRLVKLCPKAQEANMACVNT